MAIVSVLDGGANLLESAYQPYIITAFDDGTDGVPPVIYVDVYFDGTFYKTISTTSLTQISTLYAAQVDIAGAAREYLQTKIIDITVDTLTEVYLYGSSYYGQCQCYVKVRTSSADSYGVVTPGGTPPVQATMDSAAVAGDGYESDTFYFLNAALQLFDNTTSIEALLNSFRNPSGYALDPACRIYALSYAKKKEVYINDWAVMPIVTLNTAFNTLTGMQASIIASIRLEIYPLGGGASTVFLSSGITLNSNSIYTVPTGVKNLTALFGGAAAYWSTCEYYIVSLENQTNPSYTSSIVWVSPAIYLNKGDGSIPAVSQMVNGAVTAVIAPKHARIWFQNYLGQFDQWNFLEREETHKVTSTPTETPVNYAQTEFAKSIPAIARNNNRANDEVTVTDQFTEEDLPFIKQLLATSKAFIEFTNPDSAYDDPVALLLPIVISDDSYYTQQWDGRFQYRISLKYIMSNEYKIVRN